MWTKIREDKIYPEFAKKVVIGFNTQCMTTGTLVSKTESVSGTAYLWHDDMGREIHVKAWRELTEEEALSYIK